MLIHMSNLCLLSQKHRSIAQFSSPSNTLSTALSPTTPNTHTLFHIFATLESAQHTVYLSLPLSTPLSLPLSTPLSLPLSLSLPLFTSLSPLLSLSLTLSTSLSLSFFLPLSLRQLSLFLPLSTSLCLSLFLPLSLPPLSLPLFTSLSPPLSLSPSFYLSLSPPLSYTHIHAPMHAHTLLSRLPRFVSAILSLAGFLSHKEKNYSVKSFTGWQSEKQRTESSRHTHRQRPSTVLLLNLFPVFNLLLIGFGDCLTYKYTEHAHKSSTVMQ